MIRLKVSYKTFIYESTAVHFVQKKTPCNETKRNLYCVRLDFIGAGSNNIWTENITTNVLPYNNLRNY